MLFKKKSNEASEYLKENAPAIAFWVASVILVMFDARVLDVVYQLTKNVLLATGSLFATALMFFVWKNAFQYTLASKTQSALASVGMALSLLASAVFGGMDYFVRGGLKIDSGVETFDGVDLIFWGIPVLSVLHVVMLLWYWYADPKVSAERNKKKADDDHKFASDEMEHATELLGKQAVIIERFMVMAQKYGKEAALNQLDMLGIDRAPFEEIETPPVSGHGQPAMTAPTSSMTNYPASMTAVPVPVPVMAGSNGNGSKANPTPAGTVN